MPTHRIAAMADAIAHYASVGSLAELSRAVVLHTRQTLNFDRCGFFLYDAERHLKIGTWGIDPNGQLADERETSAPVYPHEITKQEPGQRPVKVHEQHTLYHQDQEIGIGTLVQCAVFDGDILLGWLFIDDYMSQTGFTPEDIDFIVCYGAVVGQLIVRQKQQDQLAHQNTTLQSTLLQLKQTQREITDSKKMAALGHLVAGIAHQLNTPLGIVVTALSQNQHQLSELQQQFEKGQLTRKAFDDFIAASSDANQLATSSANKASKLIVQFKQLATQQKSEAPCLINLEELIFERISYLDMMGIGRLQSVRLDLCTEAGQWCSQQAALSKVLDELLANAIKHGNQDDAPAEVEIRAEMLATSDRPNLQITIRDYGKGLEDGQLQQLFDPFFTKNQQKGQGLGASIAYNIVTSNLNGRLSAENCAGGGLRYIVRLPAL